MTLTVLSPGARTLMQDAGRPGYAHLGVPTSGAADLPSLRLANLLADNPAETPALEVALHGPTLHFSLDTAVAYAGAPADLFLDDRPVPAQHTIPVRAGQTLRIEALHGGVYGYLAVAGGFTVTPVLGSSSTCTLSGLGPAALSAGQSLGLNASSMGQGFRFARTTPPTTTRIRFTPGPHGDLFGHETAARFAATTWAVSPVSSRVGVRLDGATLSAPQGSLPSMGMVLGAIQVPPTGHPIVLGPDHGTVGGYPVLGVVLAADLPHLMQHRPGTRVQFVPITHQAAEAAEVVANRAPHVVGVAALLST